MKAADIPLRDNQVLVTRLDSPGVREVAHVANGGQPDSLDGEWTRTVCNRAIRAVFATSDTMPNYRHPIVALCAICRSRTTSADVEIYHQPEPGGEVTFLSCDSFLLGALWDGLEIHQPA